MDFAAQFPGEIASGAPGPIPVAYVHNQLRQWHGRDRFPLRWRHLLIAAWRADFRGYTTGTGAGPTPFPTSAPGANPKKSAPIDFAAKRKLETELRELCEQRDSIYTAEGTTSDDYVRLTHEIKRVTRELQEVQGD